MSDPKVQVIAKDFLNYGIKKMVDTALAAMEVNLKKNPKAYYKASRQIFKALTAAASQHMLEDGANKQLLRDTYSPDDAWELFLGLHPDIAAKIAAAKPKPPPKPKNISFKLIEGGKPLEEQTPAELAASLDEDEEVLVKDDGSCGCACHFEHEEWKATGHDCCINEAQGDEVL